MSKESDSQKYIVEKHLISVRKTARYFTLNSQSEDVKDLWIICHGYGQLAKYFIKKFLPLVDPNTIIIAPEGLSRFYLQGNNGRIGASWMTKEDRLDEISDQNIYLNQILTNIRNDYGEKLNTYVLGFSQGAATVCRWLANNSIEVKGLVLWGSVFPPDLELTDDLSGLKNIPSVLAVGTHDPYLLDSEVSAHLSYLYQAGINPKVFRYQGGHDIDPETLLRIKECLTQPRDKY